MFRREIGFLVALALLTALPLGAAGLRTGRQDAAVAFDDVNQRYLVVHTYVESLSDTYCYIRGQIFKADGVPLTNEFEIREVAQKGSNCSQPAVAFDPRSQRYLVVWTDGRSGSDNWDVYGKLVDAAGVPINSAGATATEDIQFAVGANDQYQPSVACDSSGAVGEFLVAWNDNDDICGRFMAANAAPGSVVTICNAANPQQWPAVAFDQTNAKFLVAWEDERDGATAKIWARTYLNEIGAPDFAVSVSAGAQTGPHLVCAPIGAKFLMIYCDSSTGNNMGQFINATTGSASGLAFPISQGGSSVGSGRAASLAWGTDRYLATWVDNRNTTGAIYGQYLDVAGTLLGAAFAVSATSGEQSRPFAVGNSASGVFLAGFDYKTSTTSKELKTLLLNVPEPEASAGSSGGSGCFVTAAGGSMGGALALLAGLLATAGFRRSR